MGWPLCQVQRAAFTTRACRRKAAVSFKTEHHEYLLCAPCFKRLGEGHALEVRTEITMREVAAISKLVDQGG